MPAMKNVTPSEALAQIIGPEPRPRTAVVQDVWKHIKAHALQDPADKRTIVADEKMRPVIGADRISMFKLNTALSAHLT